MTGPSTTLDPSSHAVRGDLADLRLAEKVFAPHYAAPLACVAVQATPLTATDNRAGAPVAQIAAGDPFEVLELAGDHAWGVAPRAGLVGYVDRGALELVG